MKSNQDQNNDEKMDVAKTISEESLVEEELIDTKDKYVFGWSSYSEITNGRFAMIGFLAIILIELFSHQSFFKWAGIF